MANVLKTEKKVAVISALAEGSSIRSIERMTGVHRDTIMRLGASVGNGCDEIMDREMRNLSCHTLQIDELWGFIGKKQRNVRYTDPAWMGDVWTFVSICADSKIVPTFKIGKRTRQTVAAFIDDLASRLTNRVQLSSDSLTAYVDAIERNFGADIDYGQIVKTYISSERKSPESRYSPGAMIHVDKYAVIGDPESKKISTSYVERMNLSLRMHCRRLTRLTNGFSKKLENFKSAIALYLVYYNFVKVHNTLRTTPAMAAGVSSRLWTVGDIVEMAS